MWHISVLIQGTVHACNSCGIDRIPHKMCTEKQNAQVVNSRFRFGADDDDDDEVMLNVLRCRLTY